MGGAEGIEIEVVPPAHAVVLDSDLELQRVSDEVVDDLWLNLVLLDSGDQNQSHRQSVVDGGIDPAELESYKVRSVAAFEFADLLVEACMTARRRILINSKVVHLVASDVPLIDSLEQRLRAGVVVHVGFDEADLGTKTSTTCRLFALAKRYPNSFHLEKNEGAFSRANSRLG